MSKCRKTQDLLSHHRTGLLTERRRAEIEAHVSECAECARELELLDSVLALVEDHIHHHEPPAGLWHGVHNRIKDGRIEPVATRLGRWLWSPARAAGAAVVVLAIAAGLYIGVPRQQPAQSMSAAPADDYVRGHVLYAGQGNLADRTASLVLYTASSDTGVGDR